MKRESICEHMGPRNLTKESHRNLWRKSGTNEKTDGNKSGIW